jgi:hypothetical protein
MAELAAARGEECGARAAGSRGQLDAVVLDSKLAPPPLGFPRCPALG